METSRKPKSHKNFYIDLDQPPGYIFTDADLVSGKCCLFSSRDEDVGSISISFHGVVKVKFVVSSHNQTYGTSNVLNYDSEDVLFSESKVLYQGAYTLRKNVLYEWPFQFQFPSSSSLPHSGAFGTTNTASATIAYELEACRGRPGQDVEALDKRMDPRNDTKRAPFQSSALFERIGSFTGMIATAPLLVSPPRPRRADPCMMGCSIDRQFPLMSSQSSGPHHNKLSGIFHSHQAPNVGCSIVLDLPRNLIHGASIPVFLRINSVADITPVSLQSIEIQLKVYKTIISNPGFHRHTDESKVSLLHQSKTNLTLTPNSALDIGSAFNLQLDPTIMPSFGHVRVRVSYDLQAHVVLECGGQKFKEDFLVEEVQVMSNRIRNSPLRRDHLCSFTSEIRRFPFKPNSSDYPGSDVEAEAEISTAFLALSRLLTQNSIPHNPVPSQNEAPTIILRGQPQFPASPRTPSPPPVSPLPDTPDWPLEESLKDDQRLLDIILDGQSGFEASSMRSGRDASRIFAYTWHAPPNPEGRSRSAKAPKIYVKLEMLTMEAFSSLNADVPPPAYSSGTKQKADPFSAVTLLNRNLCIAADVDHPGNYAPPSVLDIIYVINEFGKELRSRVNEVNFSAARIAAAKYESLREPLLNLGFDLDGATWSDEEKGMVQGRGRGKRRLTIMKERGKKSGEKVTATGRNIKDGRSPFVTE